MRIAIVEICSTGTVKYSHHANVHDFACWLMSQGHEVSVSALGDATPDQILATAHDADRILFWDEDVDVDLPATKVMLGETKLVDALDAADCTTAAVFGGQGTLVVFSGPETFAMPRPDLGAGLIEELQQGKPTVAAACGLYWLWVHASAGSRMLTLTKENALQHVGGVEVGFSRRLIEGGCSFQCDPRIAVVSTIKYELPWRLA